MWSIQSWKECVGQLRNQRDADHRNDDVADVERHQCSKEMDQKSGEAEDDRSQSTRVQGRRPENQDLRRRGARMSAASSSSEAITSTRQIPAVRQQQQQDLKEATELQVKGVRKAKRV